MLEGRKLTAEEVEQITVLIKKYGFSAAAVDVRSAKAELTDGMSARPEGAAPR
jgi:chitinase